MKKRKNIFITAIIALILILGVGYAVVSNSTLIINGTASVADSELKVVYDGVNTSSGAKVKTLTAADDSKTATFSVEGMLLNDSEYAEFEIKNKETDVNASIAVPTLTNSKSTFFEAKVYYKGSGDADYAEWTEAKTLAAQATAKVKVVVTLKQTPVQSADSTTTISVSYVASPAA